MTMLRPWRLFVFAATLLNAPGVGAQTRPSLLYSLPKDGTWVEYEVKGATPTKQALSGFLRVASVGGKEVNKVKCRWIEVKIDTKKGVQRNIEIFKILIAEKALDAGPAWAGNVLEVHQKKNADAPVKLQPRQGEEFLTLGCTGDEAK